MRHDIHATLHASHRLAELRREATEYRTAKCTAPRPSLRDRMGWTMVELGLRLVHGRPTGYGPVRTA
ncbi:hypothetical protein OG909_10640 [Streptomyces sp. NBC_01754]|uniref:hypothetical protein n=1 Tax=Streptomyces sp. NBC_01754 TaxID=2975930 RepID=UPI002DD9CE4E|nr:hypothetical protein [Streptomyces sp. NBC_01754]WSC92714.1 hypothetical protein OG909_10640 [Streptomyces sp. NBC_01754]